MVRMYPLWAIAVLWCLGSLGCQMKETSVFARPETVALIEPELRVPPSHQRLFGAGPKPPKYPYFPKVWLPKAEGLLDSFGLDMPPSGDQGPIQSSCTAFAVGYSMQSYFRSRRYRLNYRNSSRQVDHNTICSPAYIHNNGPKDVTCKKTVDIDVALDKIKDEGICTLEEMPYFSNKCYPKRDDIQKEKASTNRIVEWMRVKIDVNSIKQVLWNKQPVVIDIYLQPCFGETNRWMKTEDCPGASPCEIVDCRHAMTVCGWDDTLGAFRVQNSWGEKWGADSNGFAWIDYDFFDGVIVAQAYTAIAENPRAKGEIVLTGNLNFGTVKADQYEKRQLIISNKGNHPFTVSGIVLPRRFSVDKKTLVIPAGDSRTVDVVFSPKNEESCKGSLWVYGYYEKEKMPIYSTMRIRGEGKKLAKTDLADKSPIPMLIPWYNATTTENPRVPLEWNLQQQNKQLEQLPMIQYVKALEGQANNPIKAIRIRKQGSVNIQISANVTHPSILKEQDIFSLVIVATKKENGENRFFGKIFNGVQGLIKTPEQYSFLAADNILWAFVVCPSNIREIEGHITVTVNGNPTRIALNNVIYLDNWTETKKFDFDPLTDNKVDIRVTDNDTLSNSLLLLVGIKKDGTQTKLYGQLFNPTPSNPIEDWSFTTAPSINYLYGFAIDKVAATKVDYTISINNDTFNLKSNEQISPVFIPDR